MPIDSADLQAITLTLELASLTTALLLVIGTPIAWWLTHTRSRAKGIVTAMILGFAHSVGEFGVVLMIGGNIPGSRA